MTDYVEQMDAAIPSRESMRETRERLESEGVKYLLPAWIDLFGIPKTKPVPISDFEDLCIGKGPQFAVHSVSYVPELTPADPDQIIIPDLDAVYVCPWDRSMAMIFCDLFWEGRPYNVCPRQALKRGIRDAREAGFIGSAGIEPEFIALKFDADGNPVKAVENDPPQRDHPPPPGIRLRPGVFDRVHAVLQGHDRHLGRTGLEPA